MTVSILATTDNGDPAFGLKQGTLARKPNLDWNRRAPSNGTTPPLRQRARLRGVSEQQRRHWMSNFVHEEAKWVRYSGLVDSAES